MNNNKTNTINLTRKVNQYFTLILLITLTALLVLFSTQTTYAANQQSTNTANILIKNEPVQFTDQTGRPFIDSNNRTLVPMRIVMEKYGCTVDWEQESLSAIVKKGDIIVKVPTKQQFLFVNGSRVDTDTVPQIINGRTYLPVAVVLRAVGADVKWDNNSRSVVVDGVGQGATKPSGYDEFISNFEFMKTYQSSIDPLNIHISLRSDRLNSQELENLLLAIPEEKLKTYLSHINSATLKNTQYRYLTIIFYSNLTEVNTEGLIVGDLEKGRVLVCDITNRQGEMDISAPNYQNWRGLSTRYNN